MKLEYKRKLTTWEDVNIEVMPYMLFETRYFEDSKSKKYYFSFLNEKDEINFIYYDNHSEDFSIEKCISDQDFPFLSLITETSMIKDTLLKIAKSINLTVSFIKDVFLKSQYLTGGKEVNGE